MNTRYLLEENEILKNEIKILEEKIESLKNQTFKEYRKVILEDKNGGLSLYVNGVLMPRIRKIIYKKDTTQHSTLEIEVV